MTVACVTGASGFIGRALSARLVELGHRVVRARSGAATEGIGELPRRTTSELADGLAGAGVVYHLAGLQDGSRRATATDFDAINHTLTLRLFRAACAAGVDRFVWLSTIKVLGEVAPEPLRPQAAYAPQGDYALSKARAEQALLAQAAGGTRLVIVRPPLVYGPGVAGNFGALLRLCRSGLPLPLANADAQRSMVGLANLVDLLTALLSADLGAAEILHVRDAREWRVHELVAELQRLCGHSRRQFPVSTQLLRWVAGWTGMRGAVSRLFDPLRIDVQGSQQRLGWEPPFPSSKLLDETVAWTATRR